MPERDAFQAASQGARQRLWNVAFNLTSHCFVAPCANRHLQTAYIIFTLQYF